MPSIEVTFNNDHTVTVKVGRAVEHIDVSMKSKAELFDAIKWAAISKGAIVSDATLAEIIYEERG